MKIYRSAPDADETVTWASRRDSATEAGGGKPPELVDIPLTRERLLLWLNEHCSRNVVHGTAVTATEARLLDVLVRAESMAREGQLDYLRAIVADELSRRYLLHDTAIQRRGLRPVTPFRLGVSMGFSGETVPPKWTGGEEWAEFERGIEQGREWRREADEQAAQEAERARRIREVWSAR